MMGSGLLPRKFIFNRMPAGYLNPCLPFHEALKLILLPFQLFYSLVMVVYSSTEDLFCAILSDHELIQMFFQLPWSDFRGTNIASATQRTGCRTTRLINAGEGLIAKI